VPNKTHLTIEESGGFVGGGPTAHFRTRGEVDVEDLSVGDRARVEQLLKRGSDGPPPGSEPRYSLRWEEGGETRCVTVGRSELPDSVLNALKTELD